MSLRSKIRGTIETLFQLGLGGPQLKNNSSVIEARNSTDAGFVVVRGATAISGNDLVTFAQLPSGTQRGYYGDGNDGAAVFDGAATPAGTVKDSATAYHLTRDVYYTTISVSTGVVVSTQGWRVFYNDTAAGCALNGTGSISGDGGAGTSVSGAIGGGGGVAQDFHTLGLSSPNGGDGGGHSGGIGGSGGILNGYGGSGGNGGASITIIHAGGVGSVVAIALPGTRPAAVPDAISATTSLAGKPPTTTSVEGGGSGGGGGGNTGNVGGGGAPGQVVMVAGPKITGSGNITSRGGAGGNATLTSGSGGGGGGGVVILVCSDKSGWTGTGLVTGGAPGTVGLGGAGTAGSAGQFFNIPG